MTKLKRKLDCQRPHILVGFSTSIRAKLDYMPFSPGWNAAGYSELVGISISICAT